jgi:hypothetical protein
MSIGTNIAVDEGVDSVGEGSAHGTSATAAAAANTVVRRGVRCALWYVFLANMPVSAMRRSACRCTKTICVCSCQLR